MILIKPNNRLAELDLYFITPSLHDGVTKHVMLWNDTSASYLFRMK